MARTRVRLDSRGLAEVMESAGVTSMTTRASEQTAAAVVAQGREVNSRGQRSSGKELPVDVDMRPARGTGRIRDHRAMGVVTLVHPAGLGMQAKHGVLTRAAETTGARVRTDVE